MDALAALRLQIEWGADEALDDVPIDRRSPEMTAPAAHRARVKPADAPSSAADRPASMEELRAALTRSDGGGLRHSAKSLVLADGNPAAGLVLIGEAPSDDDDREGRPFAGPGGAILDRVLASAGLDRTRLLLTMLVPWRPPGKRSPSPSEIKACLPFLLQHLAIVRPRRIVLFGATVARALGLGPAAIGQLRGHWREVDVPGAGQIAALPMRPVESSLKRPDHKQELWADLVNLRIALDADRQGDSGG